MLFDCMLTFVEDKNPTALNRQLLSTFLVLSRCRIYANVFFLSAAVAIIVSLTFKCFQIKNYLSDYCIVKIPVQL